ncbi:MAG: FMN-binding glutamate synthase family protein [Pseudobdellovibrionaceae bacterium]
MRRIFYALSAIVLAGIFGISFYSPWVLWSLVIAGPIIGLGLSHALQRKHSILRNFPLLGGVRYLLETIRPEIQQYFIESETDGQPIAREIRSVVYQRAKMETDTVPFGTQRDVYEKGYEWLNHSMTPKHVDPTFLRVSIGGPQCQKPYLASILNISAMSYGSLSTNAVLALNGGAQLGGFYHNTGEGGVSPHHFSEGGDIVWQIGTGYFGCRTPTGDFCADSFQKMASHDNIKMIEVKISQGAKPSHGGILPASKVTPEIAKIRNVELGKDVLSPPAHKAFSTPKGLLHFIHNLRKLSGGKPVGFKLCVGQPSEFISICKAMIETQIFPDFITVDGGEGGTGAAPLEFSNSVGAPLEEGLSFVHDVLIGFDIRKHIKIIASGKVLNGFNIFSRLALGADLCNSARGMLLSIGCIQARKCNTNKCPAGVATNDPELTYGLDPSIKKVRVFNFHKNTVKAFAELLGAAGMEHSSQISRHSVNRRVTPELVKTYGALFPYVQRGSFLKHDLPEIYRFDFDRATSSSFEPVRQLRLTDAA